MHVKPKRCLPSHVLHIEILELARSPPNRWLGFELGLPRFHARRHTSLSKVAVRMQGHLRNINVARTLRHLPLFSTVP